jgi:hypothetical protein
MTNIKIGKLRDILKKESIPFNCEDCGNGSGVQIGTIIICNYCKTVYEVE